MLRRKQAHCLMDEGEYLQAAYLFEGLAQGAVRRRILRAPFLFLQTGRAFLYGGQQEKGVGAIKHGVRMLADAKRWGELYRVGHRLVDELQEKGFTTESDSFTAWLDEVLPENSEHVASFKSDQRKSHPVLPTACPNCGATVNSMEVTWMDEVTADCIYCGSAIWAEA